MKIRPRSPRVSNTLRRIAPRPVFSSTATGTASDQRSNSQIPGTIRQIKPMDVSRPMTMIRPDRPTRCGVICEYALPIVTGRSRYRCDTAKTVAA